MKKQENERADLQKKQKQMQTEGYVGEWNIIWIYLSFKSTGHKNCMSLSNAFVGPLTMFSLTNWD